MKLSSFFLLAALTSASSLPQINPDPILSTRPQGNWDSGLIDPGAVAFDGNQYHMLFNAIPEWPHPLAVGYAVSHNGLEWRRVTEKPLLKTADLPVEAWSIRANSLIKSGLHWLLYLSVSSQERRLDGTIWVAQALHPAGPWKFHGQPVLKPGMEGAWDGDSVGDAVVVQQHGQLVMYYTGFDAERKGRVGRATSRDGMSWVKHDDPDTDGPRSASDPVLDLAGEGAWDGRSIGPRGMTGRDSIGWTMLYHSWRPGIGALGLATSRDGIDWKRSKGNPVVSDDQVEAWQRVYYSTAIRLPGRLGVLVEAQAAGSEKTAIYLIELPGR